MAERRGHDRSVQFEHAFDRLLAVKLEQVYGILDGTKWHRSALLSFAALDDVHGVVTDSSAPAEEVAAWRGSGVEVVTAEVVARERSSVRVRELRRVPPNEDGAA